MPMDFLENESTDSLIYYLYSPACESCAEADRTIDALPDTVTVKRGQVEFESRVVVRRVSIYENPSLAQALFLRYDVPEDSQTTPIAFLVEEYISGAEAIGARLSFKLQQGRAVGTPLIANADGAEPPALSVAGTALAGLVAGFNPCALSMLLLFLSLLIAAGEGANAPTMVYELAAR